MPVAGPSSLSSPACEKELQTPAAAEPLPAADVQTAGERLPATQLASRGFQPAGVAHSVSTAPSALPRACANISDLATGSTECSSDGTCMPLLATQHAGVDAPSPCRPVDACEVQRPAPAAVAAPPSAAASDVQPIADQLILDGLPSAMQDGGPVSRRDELTARKGAQSSI